jgi:hypothetical protein
MEMVTRRDPERAELLEAKPAAKRHAEFRKQPDEPLGHVVARKLVRRVRVGSMANDGRSKGEHREST